jgi:serine protease Do
MAARRTHYDVLGVARDASSVDIASAFRDKLAAMQSKPDALPEAIDALREAYQTLASPARRDEYDESLPPAAGMRPSKARSTDDLHEGSSELRATALKIFVALMVLGVAFWGWKSRKAQAPNPTIVSVTRVEAPANSASSSSAAPQATRGGGVAQSVGSARSAENIFAEVSPSIVRVHAADAFGRPLKQGSGVVVGPGRVITNCHVTSGAAQITVASGADSRSASVYIADEEFDLCSLDVGGLDAPAVMVGSVTSLRTGQRVFAIGAPLGLELTISEGIVSSLRETPNGKMIQTTAPVSPGSSGGGLFDVEGKLVGIITFQQRSGQNLNFAVPADWIAEMRNRSSSSNAGDAPGPPPSAPARTAEPTVADMVLGKWWCFASLSGRNGEYEFGADGIVQITLSDGVAASGRYSVVGRKILYLGPDGFAADIDSISTRRMVQVVGDGKRLACERRG